MQKLVVRSKVRVQPEKFWSEQSIATINYELGPWIQLSAPAAWQNVKLKEWGGKSPLFDSWVLFMGLVPLDHHTFGSFDTSQKLRFIENSSSWLNRIWQHERVVKPAPDGCEIVDTVNFSPRLGLMSPFLVKIYTLIFRHRHSRLGALALPKQN